MTISQLSPDTVYVATAPLYSRARVFRTTNGGDDWTDITGSLPDRYPADLAIDPNNAANLFISFSGFGTSHLFKSTDGGDNWLDINGSLPDLPIGAVTVDPAFPEVVYAGNDIGVYISGDGGQSWSVFDSGMPIAMVSDLKISLPNRKLRVSTHGSAVFERDLYDPSTAGVADGVLDPPLSAPISILISPNPITAESRITFTLRESTALKLQLFDISGRMVGAIAEGRYSVGDHSIELGAVSLSQGIYFLRATMPSSTAETRLLVTK